MKRLSFYPRPLPLAALGLGLGVLAGRALLFPFAYYVALCAGLLALVFRALRIPALPLALLFLSVGLARVQLAYPALPAPAEHCQLSGKICDMPGETEYGWQLTLSDAAKDGQAIDGHVLLTIPSVGELPAFAYGQRIELPARLSLPAGKRAPQQMDSRFYYFSQGITCTAYARDTGQIRLREEPIGFLGQLFALRAWSTQALIDMIGLENGSIAAAMVAGDTSFIPEDALFAFRASGIAHLLAVSGLHVGMLAGMLLFLLRKARPLPQLCAIAAALFIYCLFTALSPSTLRASVMALCLLFARTVHRRNDSLSALALAFLLLVLVSPFSLFSVGFQLSFSVVLGILLLQPVLQRAFSRLPNEFASALSLPISGQIASGPVTAAYFGRLPVLGVFANLLAVPLAAFVLFPAIVSLPLYAVCAQLGTLVATVSSLALTLIRSAASFAAAIDAIHIPAPNLLAGVLYFSALAFLSPYCRGALRKKWRAAALCLACSLLVWAAPLLVRLSPHITVLDVKPGYVVHTHMSGDDHLLISRSLSGDPFFRTLQQTGNPSAATPPASSAGKAVLRYAEYHALSRVQVEFCNDSGVDLQFYDTALFVHPDFIVDGTLRYDRSLAGEIMFSYSFGRLRARLYAQEAKYDILMQYGRR